VGVVAPWRKSRRSALFTPAEEVFVALATALIAHAVIGEPDTLEPLYSIGCGSGCSSLVCCAADLF
jgi:hypothetical protein